MKYEITDNKTGRTVVVEGSKAPTQTDAEAIFQKAGLRQSHTSPEPQGNKILQGTLRALNIPSDFLGGAIKAGREDFQGTYEAPKIGPDVNFGKGQLNLGDLIPSPVVGGYRGLRDQTPMMQEVPKTLGIDPESLPGMAIGLGAEVATPDPLDFIKFGKVAEKITGKVGEKVIKSGEDLVLKGLKPSPSQQKKFLEKTGETLSKWMSRNGITSDFVNKATSVADELQNAFDEIATDSNKTVKNSDLYDAFAKRINELDSSIVPQMKNKSEDIKNVFNNLINKYLPDLASDIKSGKFIGDASFNVADLTKERKAIDKLIKESSFSMPIEQTTYLRAVRDALQESIQNATKDMTYKGKTLKDLGRELNKAYSFLDIAEQQSGLGKGTMNIGLTDLIAGGAGAMSGGDPGSRLMNMLLAIGAKRLVNSPKVVGKVSGGLQKAGSMLQTPVINKALEALMRVGKEASIQLPR